MARTKENEAEWQGHHDELKFLWLDQRWTAERIREYMSQKHSFHQSVHQYTRQFKQWGFKKNSNDEWWKFVAHRREKRKRDGKDPGQVWVHGKLVPEPKVRKEISRHVRLTSQYLGTGDSDPKTPEGVVVGTPRAEITGTVSGDSPNVLAMDWDQDLSMDIPNLDASTLFQPAARDPLAFQFEFPELSSSVFHFPGSEAPAAASFNLGDATLEHCLPGLASAGTPTPVDRSSHIQHTSDFMNNEIGEGTHLSLLQHLRTWNVDNHSDLVSALEPITIGDVNSDLTKRAEAIFQLPSPENLSHYFSLCIYLSSNNLMSLQSTDNLVSLIVKSRSQSRLRALLRSRTTTVEIFMSKLLASAAAVGDVEICRILIEAGADLDAPSGLGMRTTALHRALMSNQMECVRMLLEAGADPNLAVDGKTPLHIACSICRPLDTVRLLLQFGAHVNPPQDCARLTPLQLAVQQGNPDLVQFLLDSKANPNSFTTSKKGTALQIACSNCADAKIVELLIDAGADIDCRPGYQSHRRSSNHLGNSDTESESDDQDEIFSSYSPDIPCSFKPAILIAAENENWEVVQLLLEEGAAVNASLGKFPAIFLEQEIGGSCWWSLDDQAVFTPLQAAIRAQNITMTRMLLSAGAHIDARPKGKYGHTALQICAMAGNERLIEILLRKGADIHAPAGVYHGQTALQAAALNSDSTVLSILLREGADVNAPPAKMKGKTALQIAVAAGNTEGVRILLDANAVVNTDPVLTGGFTALSEAIKIKDSAIRHEIVHLLLRAGAYIETPEDKKQYAPLHVAVRERDLEMTRKLLEKGADPNVGFCAHTNLTPLQQASSSGDEGLVQLLIDYGADVNSEAPFFGGRTALQAAAEHGHVSVVKMLLMSGAKIKTERADTDEISAIEAAVLKGYQELVQLFLDKIPDIISSDPIAKSRVIRLALGSWKCDVPFLELLLKAGAVVDSIPPSPSKISVLQIAVQKQNYRMVQCLLSAGADVNHCCETDCAHPVTALQGAVYNRNIDVVRLLLESGADINTPATKSGGKTALQIAVSQNNLVMTKLLVDHGANMSMASLVHCGAERLYKRLQVRVS